MATIVGRREIEYKWGIKMKQWMNLHVKKHGKHKEMGKVEFSMLMLMVFAIAMELFSVDKEPQ